MKRKLILLISIVLLIVVSACKNQEEKIVENKSIETAVIEEKEVVEDYTNTTPVDVNVETSDKNTVVETYTEEQQKLIDEIKNSEYSPKISNIKGLKEFKVSDIEKTAGVELSEPYYNDVITDYNYNNISDEQKVKKACEYLLKLNDKLYTFNMENDYEEFPKYFYFIAFHNYLMESLDSVKNADVKNSKMYHLAYVLGYLARNGLYEYEKIKEHVVYLKDYTLSQFKTDTNTQEAYEELASNIHILIGILNEQDYSTDKFGIDAIYKKAVENGITNTILFSVGYLDTLNSNTELFSSVSVAGSGHFASVNVLAKDFDSKIFNEYLSVFSKNYQLFDNEVKSRYSEDFADYIPENTVLSRVRYRFFPYNKNVYIIRPDDDKLATYDLLLFTLDNIEIQYKDLEKNIFIANSIENNSTINIEPANAIDMDILNNKRIDESDLVKIAPKSSFIKDGKFDDKIFMEYILQYIDDDAVKKNIYASYYKFDINNDGKDEMILIPYYETIGYTYKNHIFLADETSLKIIENSSLGKFLKTVSSNKQPIDNEKIIKFINKYAKNKIKDDDLINLIENAYNIFLYEDNGKNNIILKSDNQYIQILDNQDNLDIKIDYYLIHNNLPKFVWNGEFENGKPVGLLNTDASFDMSKASTLSELAIVSDVNLRMLDRLSSEKYFKSIENVDENTKKNLLNKRRQMNKEIKNCKGDYKCIRDILYIDVFVEN